MSKFKNRIKQLREQHHFSQQELADKLNVHKQTISQYERGVREPDFDNLLALCDIFNVSSDYLLGKTDVTPRYLTDEELALVVSFRNADPLSRQLALRALNIETNKKNPFYA